MTDTAIDRVLEARATLDNKTAANRTEKRHRPLPDGADPIVREAECEKLTGLSRTTRWRLERQGKFPARIRLSENAIGWKMSSLARWVVEREAGRSDGQ